MFEAEADRFRSAGIRIGPDESHAERSLLAETLDPFSVELRNEALRMTRIYALIYCFENSVRSLLSERMHEQHGSAWWSDRVSKKIRDLAESRQKEAQKTLGLKVKNKTFWDLQSLVTLQTSSLQIGRISQT